MLEPTQQWNKLFPFHAYQRRFLCLTHQDVEQELDCSLCCKLLFWLQSLWADMILLLLAHSTSHHRTQSCQRSWGVTTKQNGSWVMPFIRAYISISYFSSVSSWYVFQNQKRNFAVSCRSYKEMSFILVVCDSGPEISDLTYCYHDIWKKKTPWKFAGSAVILPEICPHHYWIARSLTKMSFHLSNIYQLGLGDCLRL